jgi:hypothetical protein
MVKTRQIAMVWKTILARVIKSHPAVKSRMVFAREPISSGASSFVKASLKVMASSPSVMARAVVDWPLSRGNPVCISEFAFHRYAAVMRNQRSSVCDERKVRAISGSPANFWPV